MKAQPIEVSARPPFTGKVIRIGLCPGSEADEVGDRMRRAAREKLYVDRSARGAQRCEYGSARKGPGHATPDLSNLFRKLPLGASICRSIHHRLLSGKTLSEML